jgi:hypothetical protein
LERLEANQSLPMAEEPSPKSKVVPLDGGSGGVKVHSAAVIADWPIEMREQEARFGKTCA